MGSGKRESPVLKEADREGRMLNSVIRLSRIKIKNQIEFDQEKEQRF